MQNHNNDSLFGNKKRKVEVLATSKKKSSKKKKTDPTAALLSTSVPVIGLGSTKLTESQNISKIEPLSSSKYTPGTLALGFVLQLHTDFATVSLPSGLTGTVSLKEISDICYLQSQSYEKNSDINTDISTLLKLWQPIRCIVLGIDERREETSHKKSLHLSLRSSLINRGITMKHLLPGFPISGCVSSKEDHGFIISCGMNGVNFFLPFAAVPMVIRDDLSIGQPIECLVDTVNEAARSISLRAQRKPIAEAITRGSKLTFTSLLPGMLVNILIESIVENGLIVTFLGLFHGVIDVYNLWAPLTSTEWKSRVTVGDTLQARMVFVDHGAKIVRLSLRPHVLEYRAPTFLPPLGDVLEDLAIVNVNKKYGLLLRASTTTTAAGSTAEEGKEAEESSHKNKRKAALEEIKKKRMADESMLAVLLKRTSLVPPPHADQDTSSNNNNPNDLITPDKIEKYFKVGDTLPAKVLGYHLVEGVAVVSNKASFMTGNVIHTSQVEVGQVLEVEVDSIEDFGLVVKIGSKISAVCPSLHMSDTGSVLKPYKKFKKGQKLKMRVWELFGNAIIMSNKKSIIEDKSAIITDINAVTVGVPAIGVVSHVGLDGLRVHFYQKIAGKIPMSVLVKQGVVDAEESYRLGQIIKCVVLQVVEPKAYKGKREARGKKKLLLALDMGDITSILNELNIEHNLHPSTTETTPAPPSTTSTTTTATKDKKQSSQESSLTSPVPTNLSTSADFVKGTVIRVEGDYILVRIMDGRLGQIHRHHLTDLSATSEVIFTSNVYNTGKTIDNALIIGEYKGTLQLTCKPLLLHIACHKTSPTTTMSQLLHEASSIVPKAVSEVSPGLVVAGYIHKVETFGVLVKFRNGLTALAPRPNVTEKFLSSPVGMFVVGDSIICVVQRVDLSKERIIVTLKSTLVSPSFQTTTSTSTSDVSSKDPILQFSNISSRYINYLDTYLRELFYKRILSKTNSTTTSSNIPNWRKYDLGSVVVGTVLYKKEYGVVLMADDQLSMMLLKYTSEGADQEAAKGSKKKTMTSTTEIGSKMEVCILDIDFDNNIFEVSNDVNLIPTSPSATTTTAATTATSQKKKKKSAAAAAETATTIATKNTFTVGQQFPGIIEAIKDKYLIVSHNFSIGFVLIADYHCPYKTATGNTDFQLKQTVQVRVERSPTEATTSTTSEASDYHTSDCYLKGHYPHQSQLILSLLHTNNDKNTQKQQIIKLQKDAEFMDQQLQQHLTDNHIDTSTNHEDNLLLQFIQKIKIGSIQTWKVLKIDPLEIWVIPESSVEDASQNIIQLQAVIHISNAINTTANSDSNYNDNLSGKLAAYKKQMKQGKNKSVSTTTITVGHPFYGIAVGDTLNCRTLQIRNIRTKNNNKSTDNKNKNKITTSEVDKKSQLMIYLSLLSTHQPSAAAPPTSFAPIIQWKGQGSIRTNKLYTVVVTSFGDLHFTVALSPYIQCTMSYLDVSQSLPLAQLFKESIHIGLSFTVVVTEIREVEGRKTIHMSRLQIEPLLLEGEAQSQLQSQQQQYGSSNRHIQIVPCPPPVTGDLLIGMIDFKYKSVPKLPAIMILLNTNQHGRVCVTELSDESEWTDLSHIWSTHTEGAGGASTSTTTTPSIKLDAVLPGKLTHGSLVQCRVLSKEGGKIELSLRPSRLTDESLLISEDPLPQEGDIVKAFVIQTSQKGCFLRLSHSLTGRVFLKDLSDDFVKNPMQEYPVGKLVTARLQSINQTDNIIKLTLKPSLIDGNTVLLQKINQLKLNSIVMGTVQKITDFGVFVRLHDSDIIGLSRLELAVGKGKSLVDVYAIGDVVRAKVVGVSGLKVSLGLKPSLFDTSNNSDEEEEEEEEDDSNDDAMEVEEEEGEEDDDSNEEEVMEVDDDEVGENIRMLPEEYDSEEEGINALIQEASVREYDDEADVEEEIEEEVEEVVAEATKKSKKDKKASKEKKVKVKVGETPIIDNEEDEEEEEEESIFSNWKLGSSTSATGSTPGNRLLTQGPTLQWDDFKPTAAPAARGGSKTVDSDDDDAEDEDDDGDDSTAAGKSKGKRSKKKELEKKKEEQELRAREMAISSGNLQPESAEDFDRLLLAEPNSSLLWIQYMSLHLMSADMDTARKVAEKALRVIGFREEDEKYNIWVAYLNLEYKYGTMDSLEAVFKRAIQESKGKYLHLNLAEVYENAKDLKGAEAMYEKTLKKYKKSKKVWIAYQRFKIRSGDSPQAKALLQRSLQSLSKHKHIEVLTKYAFAEYDFGSIENGREILEDLVKVYPKRTDLWHVFIDREIKSHCLEFVRNIFHRLITTKMNQKNMKALFKKFLEFEVKYGDDESQNDVKQKARDYVSSLL